MERELGRGIFVPLFSVEAVQIAKKGKCNYEKCTFLMRPAVVFLAFQKIRNCDLAVTLSCIRRMA